MTVDEKGLQAAWNAYARERNEPWQDRVEAAITAYEAAKTAEGPVALTADDQRLLAKALAASTEHQYEIAPPPPQVPHD